MLSRNRRQPQSTVRASTPSHASSRSSRPRRRRSRCTLSWQSEGCRAAGSSSCRSGQPDPEKLLIFTALIGCQFIRVAILPWYAKWYDGKHLKNNLYIAGHCGDPECSRKWTKQKTCKESSCWEHVAAAGLLSSPASAREVCNQDWWC